MFFRNLTLFRFPVQPGDERDADAGEWKPYVPDVLELADCLREHALRDVGPLELSTDGFVSPIGRDSDELILVDGSNSEFILFALGTQERILPASVIADELAHRIDVMAERTGRRPGGKERKRMKQEIIDEFLPRAFVRTGRTLAYLDTASGWLVIDTSSRARAEAVVSKLREAFGRFPATPMAPYESPRALMTDWMIRNELPAGYYFGEDCELRDPCEAGSIARFRRQDLQSNEVHEALREGKQAFQLGLELGERMGFVLGDDLVVRKLRFLDIVIDQLGETEIDSAETEARTVFAILCRELKTLLDSLAGIFGIGSEPTLRLDGGDAPRHMREANRAKAASAVPVEGEVAS